MIQISPTDIANLKKIAVIYYHMLVRGSQDQSLQREHTALTQVLVDIITRAEDIDPMEERLRKFVFKTTGCTQ